MKRILLLDCSLPGVAVGVADAGSGSCIASELTLPKEGSSTLLAPMVQAVVKKCQMEFADFAGLLVAIGPGSFTGIRMGLAFAYGLRAALPELPIAGTSSLQAMAAGRRGNHAAWVLAGTRNQGFLVPSLESAPVSFFLKDFQSLLGSRQVESLLCGAWPDFEALELTGGLRKMAGRELLEYSLECMAIQSGKIDWSKASLNRELPEPMYLRASTAEEKLQTKHELVEQ